MTDSPFTNPFRYIPHPLVRRAALEVIERLDRMIADGTLPAEVSKGFTDGKMLGVLVCRETCLAAFSGSVGGVSTVEGFVHPIYDLTRPDGYYREREAEISAMTMRIMELDVHQEELLLKSLLMEMETEIHELKKRKNSTVSIADRQFANGEIKRAKDRWKARISEAEEAVSSRKERIDILKRQRAAMSDELQRWIFSQYIVQNASGESASILEVFEQKGLVPPGGTGDCAAPKLLNHAFRNGLTPVAMGEFWYGKSPATAVRTHGHFYPSCTSKCGPLLSYMLKGSTFLPTLPDPSRSHGHGRPLLFHPDHNEINISRADVIYEDKEIVAASKPSGMPSVPGLDGRVSLQEALEKELGINLYAVHRLDMDTSGIIIYAKTRESEVNLKKQFEEHTIRKTYMARLCPADRNRFAGKVRELKAGDKGTIELPLSPDYDERPRQKVDRSQGKEALTIYEVVSVNEDGTTDILFYPHTGRTHQLRVHSAHIMGLGRPILGDLLYGGCQNACSYNSKGQAAPGPAIPEQIAERLHLHASSITFRHPSTSETLTIDTCENSYI